MIKLEEYRWYPKIMEMLRFGVNGGLCFLVDYGILIALTELVGLHYLVAAAISFTISVIANYYLCKLWVFRNAPKQAGAAKVLFIGSSVVGLALNQFFMWIIVDLLFIHYMLAKIVTTAIVMIWNYIMKKKAIYWSK